MNLGRPFASVALALLLVCSFLPAFSSAGEPETVYIADGGHYAAGPFYSYLDTEMWVNMSVLTGGPVDLYVMTTSQYYNSYPEDAGSQPSVSFGNRSVEDVTAANLHFQLSYDTYFDEGVFIVVDNRNCTLTPDDAVPTGQVTVRLEVDNAYDDSFLGEDLGGLLLLCTILPIIVIVIICAIIVYSIKSSERKYRVPPPPPWSAPPVQPPKQ